MLEGGCGFSSLAEDDSLDSVLVFVPLLPFYLKEMVNFIKFHGHTTAYNTGLLL